MLTLAPMSDDLICAWDMSIDIEQQHQIIGEIYRHVVRAFSIVSVSSVPSCMFEAY